MSFFKNLRLGTKISVGFGIVIFIMLFSVVFAYTGLKSVSSDFSRYRAISLDDTLAGRVQANLLSSRIAFKNYINTGDIKYKKEFEVRFAKMEGFISELKKDINHTQRENKVNFIIDYADKYKNDFQKIVEYKTIRDDIYNNTLNIKGPRIEQQLEKIMEISFGSNNSTYIRNAALLQDHMLLARLYTTKFIENNDLKTSERAKSEFDEAYKWLNSIEKSNSSEVLSSLKGDVGAYLDGLNKLTSTIDAMNKVIIDMDDIGPKIADTAEEIKLSIINEESSFGPKVQRQSNMMLVRMAIVTSLAVLLAILISIWIIRIVVFPVRTVTSTFKDISEGEGDLGVRLKVNSSDELGDMARFFNKFMVKLQVIMSENKNQSWLKTGQVELSEVMRGEQGIAELGSSIITYLAKYLNSQIGAIYFKSGENLFRMFGSYAHNRRKNIASEIRLGDGLVGQAALEKQTIVISNVPEDYIHISSGVGEAVPKNIVVVPCLYEGEVKCILELGAFHEFSDLQMIFLEQISGSIAISVHASESRVKMKELLEKTMEQAEELQVQQEELRQSNEELEEQTKSLRVSEAQLQAQQEELRQSNEELEEQTRSLKESEARLQAQQEELRVINEELGERTRSLELQKNDIFAKNENLKAAQKEIEEKAEALEVASKYKSEFLANMSHELRTPLNSIIVLSQLLANKTDNMPLTDKEREFASTIYSSGSDLLKLINDILDLSKVEAGRLDINIENLEIDELCGYVERSFRQIADEKGLSFEIVKEAYTPNSILTDPQRVQQIINNLLSNAFKFTHNGGVTMKIGLPGTDAVGVQTGINSDFISISIQDTGIGIPPNKQSVIFEAFKQSDGTTSRKYGGTGLGLSISKELARLLGGKIQLKSEENKGSTFSLIIPAKYESTKTEELAAATIEKGKLEVAEKRHSLSDNNDLGVMGLEKGNQKKDIGQKSLLIIEDDEVFSNILMDLSAEKGYKGLVARDGMTGIKMADEYLPDAILLDIGLPDMSGWNVIERLRENSRTKSIPVHVVSGGDYKNLNEAKSGVIGYLKKPVDLEMLNEAFEKIEAVAEKNFKKLLVVDNSDEQIENISKILGSKGIKVSAARTGSEALELINTESFDCLILDLDIRDMPGFELLSKLREKAIVEVPIIIHTEKKLTQNDEGELQKYAESIIIKGSRSMERLIAEASLFLHGIAAKIEEKKFNTIKSSIEKENALIDKKILIVDDDMRNVFALSSVLEEKGMTVVAGRNGREGIQKLIQNPDIELVLMDIMMPEMDGYAAMREIRKDERFRKLPIIALTAKAMKDDRQKCIEAGANDYLTKPIEVDKLISLLRVWLYK